MQEFIKYITSQDGDALVEAIVAKGERFIPKRTHEEAHKQIVSFLK